MKIAYLGNYEAPWCTEVDITRELEGLGHQLVRIQEPRRASPDFLYDVERLADGCDALFFQRTWGLPPQATALWRRLEDNGCTTASYHLDLYMGLARQEAVQRDPFWTTGHVFTPDGNPDAAEWFAAHGIRHHYIAPAIGSAECYPGHYRPELSHDVVFVGSFGYHPEWPHRRELIEWLAREYGAGFHRYGGDTGYRYGGFHVDGPIRNEALNDLYASSKVVVGDSCFANRDTRYWSDRPYETWGRGGRLIFPRIDALTAQVGPYPSWDVGDWDHLRGQIDCALAAPAEFQREAQHLHEVVRRDHTYAQRLPQALAIMGLA